MMLKTSLASALIGASLLLTSGAFAADNPLAPAYNTAQQKKYFMDFCKIDLNSDGMVSMEEYLNKGNPLAPGFDKNPRLTKKLEMWKGMVGEGKEVDATKFVAYMDSNNPLSPSYKK
ncbi:MAG: hypothetical protein M3Q00_08905 [Pseudomonadota bacterium]|nr:hypothetical protein [Pseudomonadota bacterium]